MDFNAHALEFPKPRKRPRYSQSRKPVSETVWGFGFRVEPVSEPLLKPDALSPCDQRRQPLPEPETPNSDPKHLILRKSMARPQAEAVGSASPSDVAAACLQLCPQGAWSSGPM